MTPFRNRLKTPEEIELGKKREELVQLQRELAEHEQRYQTLRSEIRYFEQEYERVLGSWISILEDLEWQLKGLLGAGELADSADTFVQEEHYAQFHNRTDLLDDPPPPADSIKKSLKSLYREVAKAIHPDLASDEDERVRRQELMTIANNAYEIGDRGVLEDILSDWECGPENVSGIDVALELVRVIRAIARVKENIHAVISQLDELKATDIYAFKLRVDDAEADGINLMAEMAANVDLDIAKTRRRIAALQGSEAEMAENGTAPLETRLVRFPSDRSYGTLYERNVGSVDYRDWQRLGNARGVREVFLDKALRLDVKGNKQHEMCFLDDLLAEDLQALFLYDVNDEALDHLLHLSGLNELYLSNTTITDEGLRRLGFLRGLRRLYIYHTAISDQGLLSIASLKGLKWLTCSGTSITEEGLSSFRTALPSCKAVNFEWRHGGN